MEVGVKVTAEDMKLRQIRPTVTAYLTFVALNEDLNLPLYPLYYWKQKKKKNASNKLKYVENGDSKEENNLYKNISKLYTQKSIS